MSQVGGNDTVADVCALASAV